MPNYHVQYVRPNYSLTTLQSEIRAKFGPEREQSLGFVTGYGKYGFTGHNADAHGIAHAYDIGVDIDGDGFGLTLAQAKRLVDFLVEHCHEKFAYLIYNEWWIGNATGWKWQRYTGTSPHKDHIHISVVDLYWGDPVNIPVSVYDSREPWGVAGASFQNDNVSPISEDWLDMVSKSELVEIVETAVDRSVDRRLGDVVTVPANQGTAESRAKNPTWYPQNVLTNMWSAANASEANSAAVLEIVTKLAERSGMTKEEISDVVTEAMRSVVKVDISVSEGDRQ